MNNFIYYKLPSILLILTGVLLSSGCTTTVVSRNAQGWSYEVREEHARSAREYLLVWTNDANEQELERFAVRSECVKPHPAEGTYGECQHSINLLPAGQTVALATGEDVVLVKNTWDVPTIFATIEYGCCAGPDIARFYTRQGEFLGHIEGMSMGERTNSGNVITRTFNMKNGTRYGDKLYLLMMPETPTDAYHVQVFKGSQQPMQLPVALQLADSDHCEAWYIDKFTAYGDRKDILLELQGSFCATDKDRMTFSCLPTAGSMTCTPLSR